MRVFLLLLLLGFSSGDAYKILVYNLKFAHSHSNFLGNVADILVDAGHDVTSLIPELATKLKDGTTKSKVVRVPPNLEAAAVLDKLESGEIDVFQFGELNPIIPWMMNREVGPMLSKQCETTLASGVAEQLQKEKFDVYIVETFDICGMMLAHILNPRAIIKTSTTLLMGEHFEELGVPQPLSYYPSPLTRQLDVHSFWSRLWNVYAEQLNRHTFTNSRKLVPPLFKSRFGANYPTLRQISANVTYVFTNAEPLIDFAVPTISRVIDIAGLGAKEPKQLDEYWTGILTHRPKAVLISFGSMARSYLMNPATKAALLRVFSSFPSVTFIWKYEKKDEFALGDAAKVENLVLTDWMPQNDILNHPNLAVFITHGGMGSVQELALRGKPAILIPIFGDQPRNAAMMEHNKLGKALSKLEVGNDKKIIALLKELIEDPTYAANCARVARMLAKKPFSSKEKLIKYVEFAAEFGPSSALRPQSLDMNFIEYHNIDIIVFGIVLVLVIAYLSLKAISSLFSRIILKKVKSE